MTAITFEWHADDQTVVHVFYPRQWTWEEYHENLDRLRDSIVDKEQSFYIINEYEEGSHLPTGSPMPHYRRANQSLNIAFITYVTISNTLKSMLRAFLNGIQFREGEQYVFVDSVKEAHTVIARKRKKS